MHVNTTKLRIFEAKIMSLARHGGLNYDAARRGGEESDPRKKDNDDTYKRTISMIGKIFLGERDTSSYSPLVIFIVLLEKPKISVLSTGRGESDYVVQYNFYDVTQAYFLGEVVKIPS